MACMGNVAQEVCGSHTHTPMCGDTMEVRCLGGCAAQMLDVEEKQQKRWNALLWKSRHSDGDAVSPMTSPKEVEIVSREMDAVQESVGNNLNPLKSSTRRAQIACTHLLF